MESALTAASQQHYFTPTGTSRDISNLLTGSFDGHEAVLGAHYGTYNVDLAWPGWLPDSDPDRQTFSGLHPWCINPDVYEAGPWDGPLFAD